MKKLLLLVLGVSLLNLAVSFVSYAEEEECVCGQDPETGECLPTDPETGDCLPQD